MRPFRSASAFNLTVGKFISYIYDIKQWLVSVGDGASFSLMTHVIHIRSRQNHTSIKRWQRRLEKCVKRAKYMWMMRSTYRTNVLQLNDLYLYIHIYIYTVYLRSTQTVAPLDTVFPAFYCFRAGRIHFLADIWMSYPFNCFLLGYRLGLSILSFPFCDLFNTPPTAALCCYKWHFGFEVGTLRLHSSCTAIIVKTCWMRGNTL